MNDFLVSYLDTIDERLLEYLDDDNELSLDAVQRLRLYASSLLDGSLSPDHLAEDWADWFHLAPAFVLAYGTPELEELGDPSRPLGSRRGATRNLAHLGRPRLPRGVGSQTRHVLRRSGRPRNSARPLGRQAPGSTVSSAEGPPGNGFENSARASGVG